MQCPSSSLRLTLHSGSLPASLSLLKTFFYSRGSHTAGALLNSHCCERRYINEAIQYNTIQYNTRQYNTIRYDTIRYNTIQYNTINLKCNTTSTSTSAMM